MVIYEISVCENNCNNCISCVNLDFLNSNSEIETLIIIKLGTGGNYILNTLPNSLLHLRIYENSEVYDLYNLPLNLKKLELYNNNTIDLEKIKLPFECELYLLEN